MSLNDDSKITIPAWSQIESLVEGVHGWTPINQLFSLYTLVLASEGIPGDVLEVGSWCGRSAVVFGAAVMASGASKVHCVDLFPEKHDWKQNQDGTYSFDMIIDGKHYAGFQDQTIWKETFESQMAKVYDSCNSLLESFKATVTARNMERFVLPYRGDLASFLAYMGPEYKCRLAFLDGDHGYEAVCKDIRNIDRHLAIGGWLCFDDAFTSYGGVSQAISDLIIPNPCYRNCQQMTRKLFIARKMADSQSAYIEEEAQ